MTLLALVLCAAPVRAGGPTAAAVAFALSPAETPEVPALQAQATQALLGARSLRGIDPAGRLDAAGTAARAAAARAAAALLRRGREAFDNLDLPAAERLFGEAADRLAPGAGIGPAGPYVRAVVWQAASRWVSGDRDGAQEGLTQALTVKPDAVLDRGAFPPDFIAAAERVRGEIARAPEATFEVETDPVALVWIDGRARGPAPVRIALPPGAHLVGATAPGSGLASSFSSDAAVALKLPSAGVAWFPPALRTLATDWRRPARAAALEGLRARLDVDELVAVGLEGRGGDRAVAAIRVATDGHVLGFARQAVAGSVRDAAAAALAGALGRDLPRGRGGAPVSDTGLEDGLGFRPLGRPQVALLSAGVGAAALATGVLFGVAELHDRAAFASTAQTDAGRSAFLRGLGERNGTIADVLDVLGIAGVAGAAAIWYWPRGPASTERSEVIGTVAVPLPGGGAAAVAGAF